MKRTIRVLVADDETNLRELIVRELTRRGLEAEGVGDGDTALTKLREAPKSSASCRTFPSIRKSS